MRDISQYKVLYKYFEMGLKMDIEWIIYLDADVLLDKHA